jgi:N-ethylmaleimide reductase
VLDVWDADRVGYRVSPAFSGHSMSDSNPAETFGYLARQLSELGLGYLHVSEPIAQATARLTPALREAFAGTLIVNGGYDADSGNRAIANGEADLVAFGVPFLANPDLPVRFQKNAPLNTADPESFYGGGEKGYIDYPVLDYAHAANAA